MSSAIKMAVDRLLIAKELDVHSTVFLFDGVAIMRALMTMTVVLEYESSRQAMTSMIYIICRPPGDKHSTCHQPHTRRQTPEDFDFVSHATRDEGTTHYQPRTRRTDGATFGRARNAAVMKLSV